MLGPETSAQSSWQGGNSSANSGSQNRTVYQTRSVWTYSPVDSGGCLTGCVTFALFLVCVGQFGILAGIGFMVFYTAGAIIGSLRHARRMVAGLPINPMGWRLGNWLISFLLTCWLAGGFNQ